MRYILICLICLLYNAPAFANANLWQCRAHDANNKTWTVTKAYQQMAINYAKQTCRKHSSQPDSCEVAKSWCDFLSRGKRHTSTWTCSAFDKNGGYWPGPIESDRERALSGAAAHCQRQSAVPDSCYVRIITCKNKPFHS